MSGNAIVNRWEEVWPARKDRPAIFGPDGRVERTFWEIEAESLRWADKFSALRSGGPVALQIGNGPAWPAILIGVWRAGLVAVPFDYDLTGERRARVEELCGVSMRIESVGRETSVPNSIAWPERAPHLLKLTSGTTGEPRAIRFSAEQLLADCETVCDTMGLREDDINYGVISFAHSYGFSNLITPLICRGIPLVATADMMPRAILDGLGKSGATILPAVPALLRALARFEPGSLKLRLCVSAGAALPPEVSRDFLQQWRLKVHSFYGASECGGICYDASDEPVESAGFVGTAMRNVSVVCPGGPARIEVHSPAVGLGYHPPSSADALTERIFRPADLLEWNGQGYVISGRISEMINVAGRKVSPAEIEGILGKCPGVREVVVFGLAADVRGEEVAACVAGTVTEQELRVHCARELPSWQWPRRWLIVDALPVNDRGKISRHDLRALLQAEG